MSDNPSIGAVTARKGEWSVNFGAGGSWEFDRIEDAHRLSEAVRAMVNAERSVVAEVFDSLGAALVTLPEDLALDHRKAWIFGILRGWRGTLDAVAARHRWDAATVARVRRYRAIVLDVMKAKETGR